LPPAGQGIADGAGELALAGDAPEARLHPGPELLDERSGAALADGAADLRRQAAGILLDGVEGADAIERRERQRRAIGLVDVEELAPDMRKSRRPR
jgi:hypothetical protein